MRFKFQADKAAAVLLLAVVVGSQALAQGLGEITLDSALNQPLRAHIELLDAGKLDATQVRVALASQAEFDLAGVQPSQLLSQLKFEVEIKRDTGARILVTSTSDITEPYLDFLLGVSWPNGRTLREYTLLLDLPKRNAPVAAPTITRTPRATETTGTATQPSASTQQHEVKRGESLQQIAEQTRPSTSVGVQQMMIAIQRANEDAFVNNNVNRILTGKVLRIPRMDEIGLIDQDAALAQVTQQTQALASETLAVNDSPAAKAPARDELTLLSGDQDGKKVGGSNDLDATIKQLENQLMVSEEGLDRARLENLELTNRLSALQEQIDTLQNIIAIEDDRIAQLQGQLSKQSAATQDALAKVEASAAGDGDDNSLVTMLSNSVVLLGAALVAALGVAGMLFMRRRSAMAALEQGGDTSLDTLADDAAGEAQPSALRMVLDDFMARFRRKKPQDHDDEAVLISDEAVAAITAEQAPEVAAAPVKKAAPTTDTLLDEMGLSSEFMGLDSALDEVEATTAQTKAAVDEAEAALPMTDDAIAEAGAVMQEAALLDQALNEADAAELESAVEPEPESRSELTAPEAFAFTTEKVEAAPAAEAAAAADEKPEVFEFSLPNLEDAEADAAVEEDETGDDDDKHESIAFDTSALALDASTDDEAKPATPIHKDELEVLSFDEDSITLDDEEVADDDTAATGMDTHDARLDLAVAYEAMGDIDGAIEILDEVIASGRTSQITEAQRLKQKWQNS